MYIYIFIYFIYMYIYIIYIHIYIYNNFAIFRAPPPSMKSGKSYVNWRFYRKNKKFIKFLKIHF